MLDLGSLGLKITVDDSELNQLPSKLNQSTDAVDKLKSVAKTLVGAFAIKELVSGFANLTKTVISSYADYEQAIGGIEKIYGKATDTVSNYAENAYKSMGLSTTDYLEQSTTFGVQFVKAFKGNTKEAAKANDEFIAAAADNAATFGRTTDDVMGDFQSIAHGNYEVLDNLNLGFAGTKTGMQEMADAASELTGKDYDISNLADIAEIIEVIQEDTGIAGKASEEASKTVTGSLQSVKAAWQNLLTGLGDKDADIEKLTKELTDSVQTFIGNVIPVIERMLPALVDAAGDIFGMIGDEIEEHSDDIQAWFDKIKLKIEYAWAQNKDDIKEAIKTVLAEAVRLAFSEFPIASTVITASLVNKITGGIGTSLISSAIKSALKPSITSAVEGAAVEGAGAASIGSKIASGIATALGGTAGAVSFAAGALMIPIILTVKGVELNEDTTSEGVKETLTGGSSNTQVTEGKNATPDTENWSPQRKQWQANQNNKSSTEAQKNSYNDLSVSDTNFTKTAQENAKKRTEAQKASFTAMQTSGANSFNSLSTKWDATSGKMNQSTEKNVKNPVSSATSLWDKWKPKKKDTKVDGNKKNQSDIKKTQTSWDGHTFKTKNTNVNSRNANSNISGTKGNWDNWSPKSHNLSLDIKAVISGLTAKAKKILGLRIGMKEVPYDGYNAILHKGETVLTAAETNQFNKAINKITGGSTSGATINFNGSYTFMSKKEIDYFMNQSQKLVNRKLTK